jgi:hypothetical protein
LEARIDTGAYDAIVLIFAHIHEGQYHSGLASVIRLVALRNPSAARADFGPVSPHS